MKVDEDMNSYYNAITMNDHLVNERIGDKYVEKGTKKKKKKENK